MLLITASIISILYCAVAAAEWRLLSGKTSFPRKVSHSLLTLAILGHAAIVYSTITTPNGPDISIDNTSSLVAALISALVLLNCIKKPLDTLFIFISPIASITVFWSVLAEAPKELALTELSTGMTSHIILSILAYATFSIATMQAMLVALLNHKLKQRHNGWKFIKVLPPLQSMEHLLFNMLWMGFILLTAAIVIGGLYIEDLFEQHIVHKTVLSIAAWMVFAILIAGHQIMGWRGKKAIRWTFGGWVLLLLGYFGSKFVLELILRT